MRQSREDLVGHLREQLGFLVNSSSAFDSGFDGEARRLATTIRLLVHDTDRSASLLNQLELTAIEFYDTASDWDPNNIMTHFGLVMLRLGRGQAKFHAPLDDLPPGKPKWVQFEEWWDKTVIVDQARRQLSRRDIVLAVANQDGGAHVDPKLNAAYAAVSRAKSIGWSMGEEGSRSPLEPGVELSSLRQIAHEVISTLWRVVDAG